MNVFNKMFIFNVIVLGVIISGRTVLARTGYFWHITDVHLDLNYSLHGDPTQMCWSFGQLRQGSNNPAEFGNYECDAPILLVNSSIQAMKRIFPDPDFIVWTGDDIAHVNDTFFSTDKVVNIISGLTDLIMTSFPNTLVIPVLGNHDLFPQNQIPEGRSELQTRVADLWKPWLDRVDAYSDFEEDGRFVAHIPGTNFAIVAFNTLLWYQSNSMTAQDPALVDPGKQFEWANKIIKEITDTGKQVYLIGHIPPGSFERYFDKREGFHWYQERYNEQYIQMIKKFENKISAQLYGHHHTDSFRIFLNDAGDPISYLLIAPAVSPMRSSLSATAGATNPGIRLISYDTDTAEINEVSQYYLNLAKANQEGKDDWVLEYNLTKILHLSEISPSALYGATRKMKDDRSFFDSFYPVNTVQWEDSTACSEQCRLTSICSVTEIDYSDYYECNGGWRPSVPLIALPVVAVIIWNLIYRSKLGVVFRAGGEKRS